MMTEFQDHFSEQAKSYARYRPAYPPELFQYLASLPGHRQLLWDAGTGNGQAALALAALFDRVIATDPSWQQINNATHHAKIEYRVETAEKSSLADHSVDIITVFQALHWLDFDQFYDEVRRVLKPDGILAAVTYHIPRISHELDIITDKYYNDIVGAYWPPDRMWVDEKYQTIPFPFREISAPQFTISHHWDLAGWIGYISTWSATQSYRKLEGRDPLTYIEPEFRAAWGNHLREIRWPVYLRIGRLKSD